MTSKNILRIQCLILKKLISVNKKAHGLKAQPLKDVFLGCNPSVNRKLLTHIPQIAFS